MVITIDGLSWQGKTYTAGRLSRYLNIESFSSGMVVRQIAYEYLLHSKGSTEEANIMEAINTVGKKESLIDSQIEKELYSPSVEKALKTIVKYPYVLPCARKIIIAYSKGRDIVLDGRCTFELLPQADVKFYFESSVEERAALVSRINKWDINQSIMYINMRDSFEITVNVPKDIICINPFQYNDEELLEYMLGEIGNNGK